MFPSENHQEPPTHASGLQQRAEAAPVEHLSAMRGSLRSPPGLPRLRLSIKAARCSPSPPEPNRSCKDARNLSPRSFYLCESQWMSWVATTVVGVVIEGAKRALQADKDHRHALPRRQKAEIQPPCQAAAFAIIASGSSMPAKC